MGSGVERPEITMLSSLAECGMILVPFPKSAPGSENVQEVSLVLTPDQVVLEWSLME